MGLRNPLFVAVLFVSIFAAACGGGGAMQVPPPPAPTFTSTPGTAATEGAVYTYQVAATDPMGGAVSFSLGGGPGGARLSGNTLTWTPTAAESRIANNFSVTATTAEGGAGTQTWSVTPAGTVNISRVITNWTASGPVMEPFGWTAGTAALVGALVPQADGTFQSFSATANADGTLSIANVPGGYYWLKISPVATYWTNTSNFDDGMDILARPLPATTTSSTTTFAFNVSGLDPWQADDELQLNLDIGLETGVPGTIPIGATFGTAQTSFGSNIDLTTVKSAVVSQTEGIQLGPVNGRVLGPALQLSNLSLISGGTNTLSGALADSPKNSVDLTVKGSEWADVYNNAGPATVTPFDTSVALRAQPYVTGGEIAVGDLPLISPIPSLFYTTSSFGPGVVDLVESEESCASSALEQSNSFPPLMGQAPILTDVNLGSLEYEDPFPQTWLRPFSYCQRAMVTIPDASSTMPVTFLLADGAVTGVPAGLIAPLVNAVQNPMINGGSLFTASTLSTGSLSLSWTAPSGTAPTGYEVDVLLKTTVTLTPPGLPPTTITGYMPLVRLFTTKTNMNVPYALVAGENFLVEITARTDGRANFESSPMRSGLPIGNASVISAVMTVSASAPATTERHKGELFEAPPVAPKIRNAARSSHTILQQNH